MTLENAFYFIKKIRTCYMSFLYLQGYDELEIFNGTDFLHVGYLTLFNLNILCNLELSENRVSFRATNQIKVCDVADFNFCTFEFIIPSIQWRC